MLNSVEKTSYVLGSEHWEQNLVSLVKEPIINVCKVKKQKLHGDNSCPNPIQSQSSLGGSGGCHWGCKGMVSSTKVSCIVFVMHVEYLLVHVMCMLVDVVNISVI